MLTRLLERFWGGLADVDSRDELSRWRQWPKTVRADIDEWQKRIILQAVRMAGGAAQALSDLEASPAHAARVTGLPVDRLRGTLQTLQRLGY